MNNNIVYFYINSFKLIIFIFVNLCKVISFTIIIYIVPFNGILRIPKT